VGADQHLDWMSSAVSALDWWQEAGVDVLVDDAPRDWLAEPVAAPVAFVAPAAPVHVPAALPDTLVDFIAWRLGDAVPEVEWRGVSIAASGPPDADVMVLVDCPDKDDGAAGMLMAGPTGALFDRMLAAIGLSRETIHLAAAGGWADAARSRSSIVGYFEAPHRTGRAQTAASAGQCGEPCHSGGGNAGDARVFTPV
jgi:hypothetical protein